MMTRDLERHVAADSAAADDRFLAGTDRLDEMPYPFRVVAHLAEWFPVHGHRFRVTLEIGHDYLEARRSHDRHEVMPLQRAGPTHVDAHERDAAAAHVVVGPRAVDYRITSGDFMRHGVSLKALPSCRDWWKA
jgi:hypothetical protein